MLGNRAAPPPPAQPPPAARDEATAKKKEEEEDEDEETSSSSEETESETEEESETDAHPSTATTTSATTASNAAQDRQRNESAMARTDIGPLLARSAEARRGSKEDSPTTRQVYTFPPGTFNSKVSINNVNTARKSARACIYVENVEDNLTLRRNIFEFRFVQIAGECTSFFFFQSIFQSHCSTESVEICFRQLCSQF